MRSAVLELLIMSHDFHMEKELVKCLKCFLNEHFCENVSSANLIMFYVTHNAICLKKLTSIVCYRG